jgi:glutathione S-transferase
MAQQHTLIGSPVSYYTGKVRAYLRYKKIPFTELLSSRHIFETVILPRVGVPIIPVLITDDDQALQDSTDIIDALEARYSAPSVYPSTPLQKLVALLLEVYGDEWLLLPAMHYRWNLPENRDYAIRQFGKTVAPEVSAEEQLVVGEQRAARFAGAVPILGITGRNSSAVEASYLQLLADLDRHFQVHRFLLGTRPSIGDYGLIGPLYAHLYLDPASGRIMEAHAPHVSAWVRRMHDPQRHDGDFLPGDEVPETLVPILERMAREHVPVLLSTARHVAGWAKAHPGERKIPRGIGSHAFTVEGIEETRGIFPANLWMWQRPHDFYHSLHGESRRAAGDFFSRLPSLLSALETPITSRIVREDYRFVLAG